MTISKRKIIATAGLALGLLCLTGCSSGSPEDALGQPAEAAPTTSSPTADPDAGTVEVEAEGTGTATPSPTATPAKTVDLVPEEGGTLYLRAVQMFSPKLEAWTVDPASGDLIYERYSCGGTVEASAGGSLAQQDADLYEVTWDGEGPLIYSASKTERLTITARSLQVGSDGATSRTQLEVEKYEGMCEKAGSKPASFTVE